MFKRIVNVFFATVAVVPILGTPTTLERFLVPAIQPEYASEKLFEDSNPNLKDNVQIAQVSEASTWTLGALQEHQVSLHSENTQTPNDYFFENEFDSNGMDSDSDISWESEMQEGSDQNSLVSDSIRALSWRSELQETFSQEHQDNGDQLWETELDQEAYLLKDQYAILKSWEGLKGFSFYDDDTATDIHSPTVDRLSQCHIPSG